MKVIIQDVVGREFLGADGRWVANKAEAQDFYTLLRAYHFAQANTSGRFRVLLHSPDDDYSASIIEGEGTASEEAMGFCVPIMEASQRAALSQSEIELLLAEGTDASRLHLN